MERDPNQSMAALVDVLEENGKAAGNDRLLDPKATPEKLKTFSFGIGVPCPTRTMTRETALALRSLAIPMFGSPVYYSPDSLEVGDARNHIVECALRDKVEWLFFLDYDVIPPPHTLRRLLSLKVPIAAGVYHSKEVPSYPLIMVRGWGQAFEDYEVGDLIKADGIGMGCTLVHMDVFRKIEKECGKPWFKTCPGYTEDGHSSMPHMTEDIYFCEKAKECGYDIIVDTSIQAGHVDWRTGMIFQFVPNPNDPKKGAPGWLYRIGDSYVMETVAAADHPNRIWSKTTPPKKADVPKRLDLGSGAAPMAGYTGVDLFVDAPGVLKGDIQDLSWYRQEHGFVDAIRSSHSLEHISHTRTLAVVRDWVRTLNPGGVIEIRVPDLESHAREFLRHVEDGNDLQPENEYHLASIYGWQVGEGQEHKTGFTKKRLEQIARTVGLVDVIVTSKEDSITSNVVNGAPTKVWQLILTARKPLLPEESGG